MPLTRTGIGDIVAHDIVRAVRIAETLNEDWMGENGPLNIC